MQSPALFFRALCIGEFLASNGRGIHEAAFGDGEHRHLDGLDGLDGYTEPSEITVQLHCP